MTKNFIKKKNILNVYFIFFVAVILFLGFLQNNFLLSQENKGKCLELIEPKNINELKKLRTCIKKIKMTSELAKANLIIMKAFEGSNKLMEKIVNKKKSSNVLSDETK